MKTTGIVTGSVFNKLLLALILFICSIFSYYYIEKPARVKKYQFKKLVVILSSTICFLILLNSMILQNDGYEKRLPKVLRAKLSENNVNFYQRINTKKVVLIGDSHSGALEFSLNEELKKKNLSLYRLRTWLYLSNFNYIHRDTKEIIESYYQNNIKVDKFLE